MSDRIAIDRLTVTLEGWSDTAIEGFGQTLERALRERLATARVAPSELPVNRVSLGAVETPAGSNAAALAELVAERLVGWLALGGSRTERRHG